MSLKATLGLEKKSTARTFLWTTTGFVLVWWNLVGVGMALGWTEWSNWSGFLDWGKEFAYAAIGGFALNEIGAGIGRQGSGE